MAGAYATIANDGKYIEPTFYSKVERKNGDVVVKTKQKTKQVVSKEVAYILKEILTQPVLGEKGTATYCKISGVDVAAKTGTTDENYDRWLCGFTPYYTAATWYGYDQNESIEFNQRNPAGLIWANVMARIHTGLNSTQFEKPSTVLSATICSETGKRATSGCPHTYTEYFLWFTTPDLCDVHSGSELKDKEKTNTNTQKNVTEIIKGITDEIDEKEPPRTDNTTTTTNTTVTQTEDKKQNETNNTNTNKTNTTNSTINQTNSNTATSNTTNSSSANSSSQNTSSNTTNTNINTNTTTSEPE